MQNVLAKIISINYITKNLSYATEAGDTKIQYYDSGRLIRVLSIFDPIEVITAEDDWYFDNGVDMDDHTEYTQEEIDAQSALVQS